jgi:CBS-domain-containing membrane protein
MAFAGYLCKIRGGAQCPPGVRFGEVCWAFLGSLVGIGVCGYLSATYFEPRDMTLIVASFGASAVLLYGAAKSPLAQPRNLIGGHILSALIGVACFKALGGVWIGAALAVSLAISAMLMTRTLHPPGGATALLAVIGSKQVHDLGFLYAVLPVGLGVVVLLIVALVVNNLSRHRRYPEYWL